MSSSGGPNSEKVDPIAPPAWIIYISPEFFHFEAT